MGAAGGQARRNTMEVARRGGTLRFSVGVLARAAPGQVLEDGYAPGWTYSGSLVGQSTFKEPSPCSVKLRCPGGSSGLTMTLVGAAGDRCRHREWPLVIGADGSGG